MSTKTKGDLLENVVEAISTSFKNVKVCRFKKVQGKSDAPRKPDILIEGVFAFMPIRVAIEAKNHKRMVSIKDIDAFVGMLDDMGINLGAMVSASGFYPSALKRAANRGIMTFSASDQVLGNNKLLIPVRCIIPDIDTYCFKFFHESSSGFSISADANTLRFHVGKDVFTHRQLVAYAWNISKVPREIGAHLVELGPMKISDSENASYKEYCEVSFNVNVVGSYYLKLTPFSLLEDLSTGKKIFNLQVKGVSTNEESLVNSGWVKFDSLEQMNLAADIEDQPKEIRDLFSVLEYTYPI